MKKVLILTMLFALLLPTTLHAKNYNMVFWYPGEAGSTDEAAPILSEFFEYVGSRLNASFSGKYFNTVPDGLSYIKKSKPSFGIVSWIALEENKGTVPPYTVIARTLPLPGGATTEQFAIAGVKPSGGAKWSPPENLVIYSSIPVSVSFFKSELAPDFKGNITIKQTSAILMTLKKISSGTEPGAVALLTPMEKYTMENLESEWTNALVTLYNCKPTPSAPLVVFGEAPEITENLLKVLKEMPHDLVGKPILDELRLKGFN